MKEIFRIILICSFSLLYLLIAVSCFGLNHNLQLLSYFNTYITMKFNK